MSAHFFVRNFTAEYEDSLSLYSSAMPKKRYTLELQCIDFNDRDIEKFTHLLKYNRVVAVDEYNVISAMSKFKDEFHEFMMEKHPDKILKNSESFRFLFG